MISLLPKVSLMKFFALTITLSFFHSFLIGLPNILWITAEDMSPTLGLWNPDARTPNIDSLAKKAFDIPMPMHPHQSVPLPDLV